MLELEGKIALVTGSARGIGKGIALTLAEKGADIILNDKKPNLEGDVVAARIAEMGRRVTLIQADVSVEEEVRAMFQQIKTDFGRLDILVNNAGTSQAKTIFEASTDDWNYLLSTNLTSCFLCAKEAMELMSGQRSGRIVNISSVVGEQGALFGHVHYAATKSGMLGFTKTLARTAAPLGITVNAIAPGIIETELLLKTHGPEGIEKLSESVPLGLGTPRQIGLAVAFLCGEGGNYITGTTLDINGGMYMR
ncbi:3-oxoacyl-[acyl-carrier-protein] reductase [Rhabdobacter roseus]|uniref:NAD(P)-dependent dehydrogenase (Short-subunit alcohol dehydrogenase family) n=1 Tax=Rhabdobacter roseus TaxID=1655419 RepID=A0A840TIP2_9BACT|nr:3-oxoacyl-ACP reductase family protein [Rhabdobacter roseus]MBB5284046.1 NAD(P)-dependent dehydrogenase (short-subunit alcohol dehydrogenase family) [Rhabdobacter roseus]